MPRAPFHIEVGADVLFRTNVSVETEV